jgi:AcrR family transcriptional regulator
VTQDTDTRRATILDAALGCFSTVGYDATSIEAICASSRASVGSVYHHFGSKEGIAAALYAEGISTYQTQLLSILGAGGEPKSVVPALARHHMTWARANPEWARYLLQMGHAPATVTALPEIRRHNSALVRALAAWARPHEAAGRIVAVQPLLLLALILGPAHAVTRAWLAGATDLDDQTIEQIAAAAARTTRP